MIVAFSTASSEAAFPRTVEVLEKFGVRPRVTGFVLPLGYSFNLDGSMMYQALASLFIAQAFGIHLGITEQLTMLLVMMVTSKGIAGVPRASLVVVAATVPMFGLPAAGILLIMGVDQILDMGRTVTNVLGNGLATAAVARWQGEMQRRWSRRLPRWPCRPARRRNGGMSRTAAVVCGCRPSRSISVFSKKIDN